METRRRRARVRWPPKDGQPRPTAEVSLFEDHERCADRVDGRPVQTEANGDVANVAARYADTRICGLRALTFDMRGGTKGAKRPL